MPSGEHSARTGRMQAERARIRQLAQFVASPNQGCWLWSGCVGRDGYGKLKRGGKTLRAHRVFYEAHKGPIPEGLLVCHSCDNPLCVNPDHLWVGTQVDNEKDKDQKGRRSPSPSISHPERMPWGVRVNTARLTAANVWTIRGSSESAKVWAERLNVNKSTIYRVRTRSTWARLHHQGP
jgi:hypothetical protein